MSQRDWVILAVAAGVLWWLSKSRTLAAGPIPSSGPSQAGGFQLNTVPITIPTPRINPLLTAFRTQAPGLPAGTVTPVLPSYQTVGPVGDLAAGQSPQVNFDSALTDFNENDFSTAIGYDIYGNLTSDPSQVYQDLAGNVLAPLASSQTVPTSGVLV